MKREGGPVGLPAGKVFSLPESLCLVVVSISNEKFSKKNVGARVGIFGVSGVGGDCEFVPFCSEIGEFPMITHHKPVCFAGCVFSEVVGVNLLECVSDFFFFKR